MKILFGLRNDGADGYYRGVAPASLLRYNGYEVEARTPSAEDAERFDMLILLRHADPVAELIMQAFHDAGKPVVYDCDDWLFGVPPSAYFYGDYYHRGTVNKTSRLIHHERLLRGADRVTVTTPRLADKLSEYNPDIRVLPNCVVWADWDLLEPVERKDKRPTVGWFGLPYHWDSWREIAPALEEVIVEYDARLAVLGYPEVVHLFSDELAERTMVQPLCRSRDFGQMRRLIATFDVGIAWLSEHPPYNRYKSPLRALQLGAAGVPVAASRTVYGDVLEPGEGGTYGLVADTPGEFAGCVALLLDDPVMAAGLAERWRERVFTAHTYEMCWRDWLRTYQETLSI